VTTNDAPIAKEEEPVVEASEPEADAKIQEFAPQQSTDPDVYGALLAGLRPASSWAPKPAAVEDSANKEVEEAPQDQPTEETAKEAAQETAQETAEEAGKDTDLTAEVLGAGAAAAATATGIAVAAAVHQSHEEAENQTEAKTESEAPAAEVQPEDSKPLLSVPAYNASVPSFEADSVLAALVGDGEALLQKLNQPSTDQLTSITNIQAPPAQRPVETQQTKAVPESEPATESSQKAAAPAPVPEQLTPPTTTTDNGDEDARPTSQSRSVAALSINNASDNWLKALLRTVFKSVGRMFRPWSWGKQ
jgi:hypothetical protein